MKDLTWWNFDFLSFQACMPIISQFNHFQISCRNGEFAKGVILWKRAILNENFLIFKSAYILDSCGRWLNIMFHYCTSISNGQIMLKVQFYSLLCKWWTIYVLTSFDYYFKGLRWWNFNFWSILTCMPNLCWFRKLNFHVKRANF